MTETDNIIPLSPDWRMLVDNRAWMERLRHRVAQGRDWIAVWEPRPMPEGWNR